MSMARLHAVGLVSEMSCTCDHHGHLVFIAVINAQLIFDRSPAGTTALMPASWAMATQSETGKKHQTSDGTTHIKTRFAGLVDGMMTGIYPDV